MYSYFNIVVLLLVGSASALLREHEISMDVTPSMIRGGNYGGFEEHDEHGRHLSAFGSWSWTNLLFHLHVCHAHQDCPSRPHPGPCGCPDCSKPHPPHFQHSYCENLSAATEEVASDGSDEDRTTTGENGTNGTGQTGSSRFNGWIILAAAAAACAAVGAAVMRKRNVDEEDGAREISAQAAEGSDYKLMGGMAAAVAGVMATMGLKSRQSSEDGSVSGNSGMVSKRLSLLQNGVDVTPMAAPAPKPSFIEVQNDLDYSHDMIECDESVEVEGPYRPSSQYAL